MDFYTCINRKNVDEGYVFKTYDEYKRAVEKAAGGGSKSGKATRVAPVSGNGNATKSGKLFASKSGTKTPAAPVGGNGDASKAAKMK